MRVFIALDLNEEIRNYLFEVENELKKILKAKIKWVDKSKIHVTLKFIGEIKEEKINEIKERLRKINFEKIILELNEIGFFPNKNKPRVIWVGLKDEKKVIELQKKIDENLIDLFSSEQKFSAHLTLGRIKLLKEKFPEEIFNGKKKYIEMSLLEKASRENLKQEKNYIKNKTFEVKSFSLVESMLSKDGARYKIIEGYNLV